MNEFDRSFYVLCVIGLWILADDALATEKGREQVRDGFRNAMLAGGYEALQALPEFRRALADWERAKSGEPIDGIVADAPIKVDEPLLSEKRS